MLAAFDAINIEKADVEPDGGIECAALVDAKPGKFVIEDFGVGIGGEVAVAFAPVGDCSADAVD